MEESANLANDIAETGEFLEAGEFLYSVASLIEETEELIKSVQLRWMAEGLGFEKPPGRSEGRSGPHQHVPK